MSQDRHVLKQWLYQLSRLKVLTQKASEVLLKWIPNPPVRHCSGELYSIVFADTDVPKRLHETMVKVVGGHAVRPLGNSGRLWGAAAGSLPFSRFGFFSPDLWYPFLKEECQERNDYKKFEHGVSDFVMIDNSGSLYEPANDK